MPRLESTAFSGDAQSPQVIYVEDDPTVRVTFVELMRFEGLEVSGFDNPLAAVESLQGKPNHFDVLVSDFGMPGMSCQDLMEAAAKYSPRTQKMIMSGRRIEGMELAQLKAVGVVDILPKPVDIDHLLERINYNVAQSRIELYQVAS